MGVRYLRLFARPGFFGSGLGMSSRRRRASLAPRSRTAKMAFFVSSRTFRAPVLFSHCQTVGTETPSNRANSAWVRRSRLRMERMPLAVIRMANSVAGRAPMTSFLLRLC